MGAAAAPTRITELLAVMFLVTLMTTVAVLLFLGPTPPQPEKQQRYKDQQPEELASFSKSVKGTSQAEVCVRIAFYPRQRPPPELVSLACHDYMRSLGYYVAIHHGKFPRNYVEAMKKVPKFKNNVTALNVLLCGVAATNGHGCSMNIHDMIG